METCYHLRNASDNSRTVSLDPSARRGRRQLSTGLPPRPGQDRRSPRGPLHRPANTARAIDLLALPLSIWWIFGFPTARGDERVPRQPSLILLDRTLTQDQGAWVVEYRLRNSARTGVIITPEELGLKIEGWVSNSRLASHAVPRWSSLTATPRANPTASSDVITAADESHRCRERLTISVWTEEKPRSNGGPASKSSDPPRAASTPPPGLTSSPTPATKHGPG